MASSSTAPQDGFVLVDGPRPTEAEHIYDHFFSGFQNAGYTDSHIEQIRARRDRQDLQGVLFFDELLMMALDQDLAQVQSVYPPAPGKDGILQLIDAVSASTFDRSRRMALLYYILLDKAAFEGNFEDALQPFVRAAGLPRSMRHTMTGYWNFDAGNYRTAVSYLHQPDFVPRIAKLLNPIPYIASSAKEAEDRSMAFQAFVKLCPDESKLDLSTEELTEARTIAICHASGVRAAWLWSCQVMTPAGSDDEEQLMLRCVARIVEFCCMPVPKADAVQALVALPLSPAEEALLAHVVVNPTSNVSFSAPAHATAIDVLIVRQINSGHYIDAVLLDRRVTASLGLMHLTADVSGAKERETMRKLQEKRKALIKAASAALTRVERTLLELGDDIDAQDSSRSSADGEGGSEDSWERIASPADRSTLPFIAAQDKASTSLTASPALRSQKTTYGQGVDPLLTALAKSKLVQLTASPKRFSSAAIGDISSRSHAYSPSAFRTNRASTPNAASESPALRAVIDQEPGNVSISSPLAQKRPYRLDSMLVDQDNQAEASGPQDVSARGVAGTVGDAHNAAGEGESASVGPMAKLAQQLEEEMRRNKSTMTDILRRSVSTGTSPFKVIGTPARNAHSTLTRTREPRRYEPRYEIGTQSQADAVMAIDADQRSESPAKEIPKRRQARRAPPKTTRTRKTQAALGEGAAYVDQAHAGDTSVPGSFPGMEMSDDERAADPITPASKGKTSTGITQSATMSARPQRKGRSQRDRADVEREAQDVVPELTQTPNIRKSRSAASGLVSRPKASTPLRRSSRLSVEPESNADRTAIDGEEEQDGMANRKRASRSASPTKAKRSGAGAAKKDTQDVVVPDNADPKPVMTRSSSRRKAANSAL
jgi:hypothetical protein